MDWLTVGAVVAIVSASGYVGWLVGAGALKAALDEVERLKLTLHDMEVDRARRDAGANAQIDAERDAASALADRDPGARRRRLLLGDDPPNAPPAGTGA